MGSIVMLTFHYISRVVNIIPNIILPALFFLTTFNPTKHCS